MSNWQIFSKSFFADGGYENFLIGLKNTAIIAVLGLIIGFLIGCILVTVKLIPKKNWEIMLCKRICDAYIMIFRGTPMVVQLLLMHFALFPLLGININSVIEAIIIFGINSSAYMAEILRGGINAVDRGQMEAGQSLGFGFTAIMVRIVLPQAIKNILPAIGNEFIALIKETSVVSFIAVMDITRSFQAIADSTYEYFVPYIMLALVYLLLVMLITVFVFFLERRLAASER